MKKITLLLTLLTISLININAQEILSEDSIFQDPDLRRAHIFEYLNLPNILFNNGVELVDFTC
ncbi:MAG: hypothetical protein ACI8XB_000211 [Patiriisocius sp.]|jgi:hypothetical protein